MYDEDELLDLVDMNDEIVQSITRGQYYADQTNYDGLNLRAADLLIQNDKGELWIPRRTMDRKIAPGGLDYSCGGHIGSGETYVEGLLREIAEELNLELSADDLTFLIKFGPRPQLPYFSEIYLYKSNQAPAYNTDDFSEYRWISPPDLIALLETGEPAKTSMLGAFRVLLDLL